MRRIFFAIAVVVLTTLPAAAQSVVGDWTGTISAGAELRLVLHITQTPDGALAGTLDSVTQGAIGIPVQRAVLAGSELTLTLPAIAGRYVGTLDAGMTRISGTWSQGGGSTPLTFTRATAADLAPPRRPQMPAKPYPYREEEVTFTNPASGFTLAGTLTLPSGSGPFAAALLVTGSGPQDRDESIAGHRPFLVLADHLTRAGIAVLRVDDRGFGKSTGNFTAATMLDFATDAEAGLGYLLSRAEIDRRRLGLIGHSEGAVVAPFVAAKNPAVRFVVMLAGTGVPGGDVLLEQGRLISLATGVPADVITRRSEQQRELFAIATANSDSPELAARLTEWTVGKMPPEQARPLVQQLSSPWMRHFLGYDPAGTLRTLSCPVLALNGSLDLQVPPAQNLPPIRAALQNNRRAEVVELPSLNHLFQTAKTGSPAEYVSIEETMAPVVLEKVAGWIKEQ